mmetsp:Transcript_18085/g.40838  ORF Transcript_18085/g.40838 Transcript_18085/m.40838 type:complete len:157 (-) Transcript_18085:7-477(-)
MSKPASPSTRMGVDLHLSMRGTPFAQTGVAKGRQRPSQGDLSNLSKGNSSIDNSMGMSNSMVNSMGMGVAGMDSSDTESMHEELVAPPQQASKSMELYIRAPSRSGTLDDVSMADSTVDSAAELDCSNVPSLSGSPSSRHRLSSHSMSLKMEEGYV